MKRFNLLFLFSVLSCLFSFGQTIDFFEDNENFFVLSPNGRYSAGAIESFPAFFYDITEKKFSYCQPEFDRGYFTNAINNELSTKSLTLVLFFSLIKSIFTHLYTFLILYIY